MYGTSSCGDYDEDSSRAKYDRPYSVKNEYIGNARIKRTEREFDRAATTEYIAHDGTKLKESYVNAKEQVLADSYKIRTSPDGKEQWFYTPEGKPISKAEFKNRGLE